MTSILCRHTCTEIIIMTKEGSVLFTKSLPVQNWWEHHAFLSTILIGPVTPHDCSKFIQGGPNWAEFRPCARSALIARAEFGPVVTSRVKVVLGLRYIILCPSFLLIAEVMWSTFSRWKLSDRVFCQVFLGRPTDAFPSIDLVQAFT